LAAACVGPAREGAAGADAVAAEYDRLFIGVGRAPVALHASWYLTGFLNERPLAELRTLLATWGFARREDAVRTEDHVASLLEAMAMLADSDEPEAARRQRELFEAYLAPWYARLAEAIDASAEAGWYRPAAAVLKTFLDVERQAFDFES
ncbi:MAG TPA: molecular chaperone TorD family protein, partial [Burkholderiaceae bacterium]|nr:molecular chaperone TorD family protein [Burkholderiaceae bacterium]